MKLLPSLFFVSFLLLSCNSEPKKGIKKDRTPKGNISLGGVFKINENEYFSTLYPHHVDEIIGHQIASQIYEGLVKLSAKDLTVLPSIAKKWEISADARSFKFHLRKGVFFTNDDCFKNGLGREVTANDFKYCFEKLCTHDELMNTGFYVFQDRVIGANAFYESTKKGKPLSEGVSGIKVLNDTTLQIDLEYPYLGFLNMLTLPFTWVFPQEAVEKYGSEMRTHCVGTGPFYLKSFKYDESLLLLRNENYWNTDNFGNQLPYLDVIKFSFNKEKTAEYLEFRKGNLDMINGVPSEMYTSIIEEYKSGSALINLFITPIMSVDYYGFQTQGKLFENKKVRQAFNYAIDRDKIAKFILHDQASSATNGVVPPSVPNYDSKAVKGYTFNPELAKKLLAEAGYPNGKGFPGDFSLLLNSGGDRNIEVAQAVQKMLSDNLNIPVRLNILPFAQKLEQENNGVSYFWKAGWVADYPDPQSFLDLFYGKLVPDSGNPSPVNSCRYKSALFDSLYEAALKEADLKKRYALYQQADQVVIDDAALLPIYYDQSIYMTQKNVINLDFNALDYLDFSAVYFKKSSGPNEVHAIKGSAQSAVSKK